ncbi:MAG: sulfotransferase family 2 domain-containing protein [Longimicrobiales bacterium]
MPKSSPSTLLFHHLPKMGGTTLLHLLRRQYPDQLFEVMRPSPDAAMKKFQGLPEAKRASFRAISGHMHLEFSDYIPNPVTRITLLRDPIERVVSEYFFVLRSPGHPKYPVIHGQKMTLDDVLAERVLDEADNGQTRILCGIGQKDVPYGACTPDMLQMAQDNLDRFAVVGVTERFDEVVGVLSERFGWKLPRYEDRNVTAGRPKVEDLPSRTQELLQESSKLDLELYRGVLERFRALEAEMGLTLKRRVKSIRRTNRAFEQARRIKARFN